MLWWISLVGSTLGFTLGSALLKRFADTAGVPSLAGAFAVLAASNLLFVYVLRGGFGQGIIASSMVQVILVSLVGIAVFDERLTAAQILGVVLAATSVFLVVGPGHTRIGS